MRHCTDLYVTNENQKYTKTDPVLLNTGFTKPSLKAALPSTTVQFLLIFGRLVSTAILLEVLCCSSVTGKLLASALHPVNRDGHLKAMSSERKQVVFDWSTDQFVKSVHASFFCTFCKSHR